MNFEIKQIGKQNLLPAVIIEVTINGFNYSTTEDVAGINGKVDESLVVELRELVDVLEEQNRLVANYKMGKMIQTKSKEWTDDLVMEVDEQEVIRQGQSLPIDSVSKCNNCSEVDSETYCKKCYEEAWEMGN